MAKLNHISFIMDGNGRWAKSRNKPRVYGHLEGVKRIPEIVEHLIKNKIKNVSFFAFSTENWNRSTDEVNFLLSLLNKYLTKKILNKAHEYGIRVHWIGFEDNLDKKIISKINNFVEETRNNKTINVYVYFNYGFEKDCNEAVKKIKQSNNTKKFKDYLLTAKVPQIDLLIRTSGEKRISNYSFAELLYTEIIFEDTYWPDYKVNILEKNILEFEKRKRRYGKA